VPNALAWPLVSFPAGFADGLPVSVQLWGPRFSEVELTQAMIDYQARHPEWHTAIPPDPAPKPAGARMSPQATAKAESALAPEYMNDPVATEEALR
jgi:amidase/aspartyl-tRNA(Asn)/glutamyl-tRNA(Gln) amidotransferase subunit A